MTRMDQTQKLDLDTEWLDALKNEFHSARVTDEEMCDIMKEMKSKLEYFLDPHTAVAVSGAKQLGYPVISPSNVENHNAPTKNKNFAIMATASPCKFEESVTTALGQDGWNEFCETQLPQSAKDILSKDEITPTRYIWQDDKTLEENQIIWENLARKIIEETFTK